MLKKSENTTIKLTISLLLFGFSLIPLVSLPFQGFVLGSGMGNEPVLEGLQGERAWTHFEVGAVLVRRLKLILQVLDPFLHYCIRYSPSIVQGPP